MKMVRQRPANQDKENTHISCQSQLSLWMPNSRRLCLVVGTLVISCHCLTWSQTAPMSPNLPWHSSQESSIRDEAQQVASEKFKVDAASTYSLAELIDLAESHNPETRVAWERARSLAEAFGVARSEFYPTLVAVALSQTTRQQAFLNTSFFRQVVQSSDLAFDLNYTIFDFGERSGRIDQARARLLAADFNFNDTHRRVIIRPKRPATCCLMLSGSRRQLVQTWQMQTRYNKQPNPL
jgi:outer membrane protein